MNNEIKAYINFLYPLDMKNFFTNISSNKNGFFFIENVNKLKKHWSTYKLQIPIFNRLMRKNISDEQYILCIFYKNYLNEIDIQFGTSETAKFNEIELETLRRCLGEELGLKLNNNINYQNYLEKFNYNKKNVNLWTINIKNLLINQNIENENHNNDNRNNKTYCIIYGDEEDIFKYIKTNIKLNESPDNIRGIICFKWKDLKKIFN
jgi:hypothetical protein